MSPQAVDAERAKYERIWKHDDYRAVSPGEKAVDFAVEKMGWEPPMTVADLGCGTGRASTALASRGFDVVAIDIAANCLDADTRTNPGVRFEVGSLDGTIEHYACTAGYCTDVMEHIPPGMVGTVLENIAKGLAEVFFSIAHFDDEWHGETLHLTVNPPLWWDTKLRMHFSGVERLQGYNPRPYGLTTFWRCSNATPEREAA